MAYSDDAVRAKLASLNETQDSIVANAQWIMFHRRHADKTASIWLERLQQSSTAKRLNLIYLANEVVQQSRARGKHDFLLAFEPIVADATASAYKGANTDVQGKLKRVVEVWRQRSIFDARILDTVEQRIAELDKARGSKSEGGKGKLGGSLFGGSTGMPSELEAVSKSQAALTKADVGKGPAVLGAQTEYSKLTDSNTSMPTPPVHAARLSALMRSLVAAQGAVEASIKTRKELLAGLEKLVESNKSKLAEDEATMSDIATKKESIETKKKEVEDGIMRGLSAPTTPTASTPASAGVTPNPAAAQTNGTTDGPAKSKGGPEAPEAEGFTPPPPDVETFTPPAQDFTLAGDPAPLLGEDDDLEHMLADTTGAEGITEEPPNFNEPPPAFEPPTVLSTNSSNDNSAIAAANNFLDNLNLPALRQASAEIPASNTNGNAGDPRLKRRKISHKASNEVEEDIFGAGNMEGVDEDSVAAMLGQ